MKVIMNGREYNLSKSDFLASGGEGDVYAKPEGVFKIYHDKTRVLHPGKFAELSKISSNLVIKPTDLLYSGSDVIGYRMDYVKNTYSLCQLFTKSFKDRMGVSSDRILYLVRNMSDTLKNSIHSTGVLVVDLNELNCLADKDFNKVFYIDVDSWQTKNYRATAIMDSVRDWNSNDFDEGTDWFSFAVVTFQMLVGIHPYRGRYPQKLTLIDRMKQKISVFNKDVSVPTSCEPLDSLPPRYKSWYESVFEDGMRDEFPEDRSTMLTVVKKVKLAGTALRIEELFSVPPSNGNITGYYYSVNCELIKTSNSIHKNRKSSVNQSVKEIIFWQGNSFGVNIDPVSDDVVVFDLNTGKAVTNSRRCTDGIFLSCGRLYSKYDDSIFEFQFAGSVFNPLGMWKLVAKTMPMSTKILDGFTVQNMLGRWVADIYPSSGKHIQISLPKLDGKKIISGSARGNVIVLLVSGSGKYDRYMFKVTDFNGIVEECIIKDVPFSEVNMILLDSGVYVLISEDSSIEFFRNSISSRTEVTDQAINNSMRLYTDGASVIAADGNRLLKISTK